MPDVLVSVLYDEDDYHQTWVARITGTDETYGLARTFFRAVSRGHNDDGKPVKKYIVKDAGLYQICTMGERHFVNVDNGQIVLVEEEKALQQVSAMDAAREQERSHIDDLITRVNSQGEIVRPGDN